MNDSKATNPSSTEWALRSMERGVVLIAGGVFKGGDLARLARLIRARLGDVAVVNTYVPQGTDPESPRFQYKLEWFDRVRGLFERHYKPDDLLVWVGDLNVAPEPRDVYDPERLLGSVCYHPDEHQALAQVVEWGLVDEIR